MAEKKRSEEEKLCKAAITVILGGKEYNIEPLVIKESRTWRAEVAKVLGKLPDYISVSSDDPAAFKDAMDAMLVQMPQLTADLFFSYAKSLNRDEIEAVATDMELAKAFEEVSAVAFPLTTSLVGVLGKAAPR